MKNKWTLAMITTAILTGCADNNKVTIDISDEVINAGYIGNGIEWDPYDETESWGNPLSESDWQKVLSRLDYMRPAYVRCMINSPFRYFDRETGEYNPEKNIASISTLLDYCQKNGIMVVYGEYNPPTWDMKEDQKWVDMSVDYLNKLVIEKGYDCIKHFVIFNEPDGDWASTNGDFDIWYDMLCRFHKKMAQYPGLLDKVSLAGPDVVAEYKNPNSEFDTAGWIKHTAEKADSLIGLYDIHSYPGQAEVRSGSYGSLLKEYKSLVPDNKKIILGEAGYKYWREADSALMAEYNRRVDGHPFTKGSDCNMLVYDYFYGVDMPLFISEVMNSGFSGVAAWMLDDAMHSQGDSGHPEDIKIWGMWNILGSEVFGDASQEDVRPWYYSWSLMCRYFPNGCDVLKTSVDKNDGGIFTVAAVSSDYKLSVAVINVNDHSKQISIRLPRNIENAEMYRYSEPEIIKKDAAGVPQPEQSDINGISLDFEITGNSMILLTEIKY